MGLFVSSNLILYQFLALTTITDRIDKIRKDRNTELLEKYFENCTISEFIECISGP